jgi:hypothetical protein
MPPDGKAETQQKARLIVDAHSAYPAISVRWNRDVVFEGEDSVPSVEYFHLEALNGSSFDRVYLRPASTFVLRMHRDNFLICFDQEIGNEEFGVFTRQEKDTIGLHNRHYLAQDGTWKPCDKGYDFPEDAVRIPIFAPKPRFP